MLDLDIWKWEPQIKKIDRALLELYRTRDARYTEDVFFTLQSLSDVHIFFKLLFLDWSKRLNEAEKDNFAHASDMLPHKAIAHIPSNIDYAQKQIKDLLERVLDMDASKRSVSLPNTCSFKAGDGSSGILSSPIAIVSNLQNGCSRFVNSSIPAVRYFSLILPTQAMVIFI